MISAVSIQDLYGTEHIIVTRFIHHITKHLQGYDIQVGYDRVIRVDEDNYNKIISFFKVH